MTTEGHPIERDVIGRLRVLDVPGISCDHCKAAIESAVGRVDGVDAVHVDVESRTVTVTGGETADIVAAVNDAGYDVA